MTQIGAIKSPDRVLFYLFLALCVWMPLPLGSNRPWASSLLEIGTFILAGWWLILYTLGRVEFTPAWRRAWPVSLLFVIWLLYLAITLLPLPVEWVAYISPTAARMHALTGGDALITLTVDYFATSEFLLRSISLVLFFFLALLLFRRGWRIRLFVQIIVWSAVFQAVYGSLMTLSGLEYGFFVEKEHYRGFATGTFVNRNHLAGFLEMALALGIGLLMADLGGDAALNWRQRIRNFIKLLLSKKIRLRVYLAIMVIGLVLTRSRMGNTAFFSSLLFAGAVWLLLSYHRPKRSTIILLVSLLAVDLIIVGQWFGIDKVVERLEQTSAQSETRDEVVEQGLAYSKDYQWVGSGGGSFHSTFPGYRQGNIRIFYRHAHNDFLQFLLETGVIGILLLGLTVLLSFSAAIMAIKKRRDPLLRGLGFSGVMGITALMIHSTVDFNLQIQANATLFVLIMALSWVAYGHQAIRSRVPRKNAPKINKFL